MLLPPLLSAFDPVIESEGSVEPLSLSPIYGVPADNSDFVNHAYRLAPTVASRGSDGISLTSEFRTQIFVLLVAACDLVVICTIGEMTCLLRDDRIELCHLPAALRSAPATASSVETDSLSTNDRAIRDRLVAAIDRHEANLSAFAQLA